LDITGYYKIDLINSTIAGNILNGTNGPVAGFGTSAASSSELNIYNSILYGNSSKELLLTGNSDPSTCRVYYSNIDGGQQGVVSGNNILVWGPGNIDNDPLWDTTAAIPYALPWNSPCVNTGAPMYQFGMEPPYIIQEDMVYKLVTFDYDTITLPQADLAGNPSIMGGRIDMGAYECQDTATGINELEVRSSKFEVEVFPNPFYSNTIISFELKEKAETQVIIYDLLGNVVKKLEDATLSTGKYNLNWSGDDNSGQKLSNGIYMISLIVNGKHITAEKVVKKGK